MADQKINNPANETAKPSGQASLPVGPLVEPIQSEVPARTPLTGRYIALLPPEPERDAPDLFEASHGDEAKLKIWTYMGYGPFAHVADMKEWLGVQANSVDPLFLTVVDKISDKRVGLVSFLNIVPAMRRLEVGHIWYGTAYQRTKVNTEAIYLLLVEAFDRLRYRRVEWKCDALNERSRRAALRLGFSFEGIFNQHMIVKGRNRDTAWFALLDHDWPAVKRNMKRWLYETDTGAAGQPLISLAQLNAGLQE